MGKLIITDEERKADMDSLEYLWEKGYTLQDVLYNLTNASNINEAVEMMENMW